MNVRDHRAKENPRWKRLAIGVLSLLLLWQLLSLLIASAVLPSPVTVVPIFVRMLGDDLGLHFLASTARVVAAILLGALVAVPTGLALGLVRSFHRVFSPLLDLIHPIPKIVFLPVIYVLIGVSDFSKVLLISLILFFQILVVVRDEALGIPRDLITSARSLGAGRLGLLLFVYIPGTVPAMLTALRVSVGTAVAVLFIAEQSLTEYGLGYFIVVESYQVLRYTRMYAGIMAISVLGLVLYGGINMLERRFARHNRLPDGADGRAETTATSHNPTAVRDMFDRVAGSYDTMNRRMTFGRDREWRRFLVSQLALEPGARALDVATGTGDLIAELRAAEPTVRVTGIDFSSRMLELARPRFADDAVTLVEGDALELPFSDAAFDCVVSGFLIRNVADLPEALGEQYRVLRPGGTVGIIDTTRPVNPILSPVVKLYFRTVVPLLARFVAGDVDAYRYLTRTTERFKSAEEVADAMHAVGFHSVGYRRFMLGSIAVHWGRRP